MLPGGLSAKTFVTYAKGSYGVDINVEQAQEVKNIWLRTYPEMKLHLQPDTMATQDSDGQRFTATTMYGFTRNYCGYCEAANLVFQALGAHCSKHALWDLYEVRQEMVNFVHVANISREVIVSITARGVLCLRNIVSTYTRILLILNDMLASPVLPLKRVPV